MCYPDNKDNKVQVICTPATKLPDRIALSPGRFYDLPTPGMPGGVLSWITCAARSRISSI